MAKRAAFVTIGQAPRIDLVPEMVERIGDGMEIVEFGALDGLSRLEIDAMAPGETGHRLVTRLADGSEVVVAKERVRARLQALFAELDRREFFLIVLLCTGHFGGFASKTLFVEAQAVVDGGTAALGEGAAKIGVMVPLERQVAEIHYRPRAGQEMLASHASPYTPGRLGQAAGELADADLIVMHCMGYDEAMRATVAEVSGRPVLLARRMVAAAVQQLV